MNRLLSKLKSAGEWNAESQRAVLESALNEVITNLLNTTKRTFINNGIEVSDVVERYVEAYIQSKK